MLAALFKTSTISRPDDPEVNHVHDTSWDTIVDERGHMDTHTSDLDELNDNL